MGIIEKNNKPSFFEKISKSFIKNDIKKQNEKTSREVIDFIVKEQLLLSDFNIILTTQNKIPHYAFETQTINIPFGIPSKTIQPLFDGINKFLGNKTWEFTLIHEIGHGIQHSTLQGANYKFEPVKFSQGSSLNYIFNGATKPLNFNVFLSSNYMESYSDCYAGFVMHKKNNDLEIFDQIINYRIDEKNSYKKNKGNKVNPYFNIEALKIFKNEILNNHQSNKYIDVHQLIEKCILKGIVKTIIQEMEYNNSMLKECYKLGEEYSKYYSGKNGLESFFKRLKDNTQNYNVISNTEIATILSNNLLNRIIPDNTPDLEIERPVGLLNVIENMQNVRIQSEMKSNQTVKHKF